MFSKSSISFSTKLAIVCCLAVGCSESEVSTSTSSTESTNTTNSEKPGTIDSTVGPAVPNSKFQQNQNKKQSPRPEMVARDRNLDEELTFELTRPDDYTFGVMYTKVPGGWLLLLGNQNQLLIPDKDHQWDGTIKYVGHRGSNSDQFGRFGVYKIHGGWLLHVYHSTGDGVDSFRFLGDPQHQWIKNKQ